jgi:hypothetical protein
MRQRNLLSSDPIFCCVECDQMAVFSIRVRANMEHGPASAAVRRSLAIPSVRTIDELESSYGLRHLARLDEHSRSRQAVPSIAPHGSRNLATTKHKRYVRINLQKMAQYRITNRIKTGPKRRSEF